MNKFQILKLHDEPYDFLVIATSYENPLSSFSEIEKELNVDEARLLFDLTLINGTKKNRYIKCDYQAGTNSHLSCSLVDSIDDYIRSLSHNFFTQNDDVIQKSVIPNSLKFLLKSDMV